MEGNPTGGKQKVLDKPNWGIYIRTKTNPLWRQLPLIHPFPTYTSICSGHKQLEHHKPTSQQDHNSRIIPTHDTNYNSVHDMIPGQSRSKKSRRKANQFICLIFVRTHQACKPIYKRDSATKYSYVRLRQRHMTNSSRCTTVRMRFQGKAQAIGTTKSKIPWCQHVEGDLSP